MRDTASTRRGSIFALNSAFQEDGATAIVGPDTSSQCETLSLLGAIYDLPLVSYWYSSPTLSNRGEFPFFSRTYASDAETVLALPVALQHFGWRAVSLLYDGLEEYTDAYAAGLRSSLPAFGIELVGDQAIDERDATTFAPALDAIRLAGANIVLAIVTDLQGGALFEVAQNASMLQE